MPTYNTQNTVVTSTDVVITKSVTTIFPTEINIEYALGGMIHGQYQWTTAPTAAKKLSFYLMYSRNDGTTGDTNPLAASVGFYQKIGELTLEAVTTVRNFSLPIPSLQMIGKKAKLFVYTDEATNNGTMKYLEVEVRQIN